MSTLPGLAAGRRAAEALMSDTLEAFERTGWTTDADGFKVPAYTSRGLVNGKIQSGGGADTAPDTVKVGDVDRIVLRGGLHIPIGAPVPTAGEYGVGWEYVCVAVGEGESSDPALLGRRWLVVGVPIKTYATARRLDVAEV